MNSSIPAAGSDASLTPAQRDTLRVVLNMIVPPAADGRMPGAADASGLLAKIAEVVTALPTLCQDLDALEREAIARYGACFAATDEPGRLSLLHEMRRRDPTALARLALETVTCYYQQDQVLEGLGMEARPPFPKGYQVALGDLSLLNPVIARGRIYRDVP